MVIFHSFLYVYQRVSHQSQELQAVLLKPALELSKGKLGWTKKIMEKYGRDEPFDKLRGEYVAFQNQE